MNLVLVMRFCMISCETSFIFTITTKNSNILEVLIELFEVLKNQNILFKFKLNCQNKFFIFSKNKTL